MTNKIPEDAFAHYVSLGAERSYEQTAKYCGVGKRAVVDCAARENWAERLAAIEKDARERVDKKLGEDIEAMGLRHRKLLRAMASRAAKAISELPLVSGMEGIKAAEIVVKLERLLAGEPNEHSAITVAQVTKQEMDRFLAPKDEIQGDEDW